MSAITQLHAIPARGPVQVRPSRPQLRLVPTGDAVPDPRRGGWRMTRRGRVALLVAALVVAVGVSVAVSRAFAATPDPTSTVTVQPGQTLSGIAHAALPALPVGDAVARIQVLNGLNSLQVGAGQTLRIPR